jgi:hypothetical protein
MKLAVIAALALLLLLAISFVRPVLAEDDCAFDTYRVERLPLVGLVCIGEPI